MLLFTLAAACSRPSTPPPAAVEPPAEPSAEPPAMFTAPMVQRPLPFDQRRIDLTVAYLQAHVDPDRTDAAMEPRAVVLHWTAAPTLEASFAIFEPVELRDRPDIDDAGRVNVSAHFLVDRDGTIHRLMPDTVVARHVIGLNQLAIGVENVGSDTAPLTNEQAAANADLIRHLVARHPITHLLGHHEYQDMEGHPYFQERDPDYRTTKVDPGDAFMEDVRQRVADLGLESP